MSKVCIKRDCIHTAILSHCFSFTCHCIAIFLRGGLAFMMSCDDIHG